MLRPTALVAVLLAALATAVPAPAKTLVGMSVCGAKGCVDRTDRIGPQSPEGGLMDVGTVSVADPGRAPFVRLKLHIGARPGGKSFGTTTLLFIPKTGLARNGEGVWFRLPASNARRLRALAHGVARLPASRLTPHRPAPIEPTATVVEVVQPPAQPRDGGGGSGGISIVLLAGLGAAVAAGGVARVLSRRRRHAITETPGPG